MVWTEMFLVYLALTPIAFFVQYTNSIDWNARLSYAPKTRFHQRALRLLVHDYFEVHCPWSWEVAKRHRLIDMRILLGVHGRNHELLGHLVASDCDDPAKQEGIARKTYISRLKFWVEGMTNMFTALPRLILLAVVILLAMPIALGLDGWDALTGK